MNTLLALNSTAVASCVPTKNSIWMRSRCAAVFVSSAKPGFRHPGTITALGLLAPVQSCFSKLLLRQYKHPKSLPAVACTPLLPLLLAMADTCCAGLRETRDELIARYGPPRLTSSGKEAGEPRADEVLAFVVLSTLGEGRHVAILAYMSDGNARPFGTTPMTTTASRKVRSKYSNKKMVAVWSG
jgi:hypothetical protein